MIWEAFKLALLSIWQYKARAALTILGIVIGISSVVMFMAVGEGLQQDVRKEVTALGTNLIAITPGQISASQGPSLSLLSGDILQLDDVNDLAALPTVDQVAAFTMVGQVLRRGSTAAPAAYVFGSTPNLTNVLTTIEIATGRFFTSEEDDAKANVIVLGSTVAETLFGDEDPIGQKVQLGKADIEVIGVTKVPEGSSILGGSDYGALSMIPLQTAGELSNGIKIMRIMVNLKDSANVDAELPVVKNVLLTRHAAEDFSVLTQEDMLDLMGTVLDLLTVAISAIAAISLLVAGVGIMNIMLVSVAERTKEIGLRKAVGATTGAVLWQFLIEAVVLSVLGALIAVAVAWVGATAATQFSPLTPVITPQAVLLAVGVGVAVGLIFGIAPAYRAAKMDPLRALRYE